MKHFTFLAFIFSILTLIAHRYSYNRNMNSPDEKNTIFSEQTTNKKSPSPVAYKETSDNAIKTKDQKKDRFTFDSWEMEDVRQWQASRGHSRDEKDLYDEMDFESLLTLADQSNDIYAMVAVANKLHLKGDLDGLVSYHTKAAIHGSVEALFSLGLHLSIQAQSFYHDNIPKLRKVQQAYGLSISDSLIETKRNILLKSIAYQIAVAKRGEFFFSYDAISRTIASHKDNPLTHEEIQKAISDSRHIMNNLDQARRDKGLSEFDNSYNPSYLKMYNKLYGLTEKNYSEKMLIDLAFRSSH